MTDVWKKPKQVVKRIEHYSRWILLGIFEYARLLGVINCRLDRQRTLVYPVKKWFNIGASAIRLCIIIAYWDVIPALYIDFITKPSDFLQLFSVQQIISVAVFSTALFVMKVRDEVSLIGMVNRVIRLNREITGITNTNCIFCKQFLILTSLKGGITLLGYINELPTLLSVQTLNFNKWFGIAVGVFLWLGSMFVLDASYLGFLIISLMYGSLGKYLQTILNNMQHIESGSDRGSTLTPYHRMKLLCDYSEKLDDISLIYSRLYRITKDFAYIFQWHILYYIYYNFMVIFLLLSHCIWQYIRSGYVDIIEIFMVAVKIGNLALLIMCANYAVEKSEMPNQLNLDVVCSDIDIRWDTSVSNRPTLAYYRIKFWCSMYASANECNCSSHFVLFVVLSGGNISEPA